MTVAVDAVVAEVARAIDADLAALTTEMTDWFVEVIPEFRHDEAVRKLMIASTSSNLVAIVDVLAHGIPIERITVPVAAAEYARRFAQHDLSLEALLRAYRLGEHRFGQWAIATISARDLPAAVALGALSEIAQRTNSYIDQVIEGLISIYETEHRRWNSRTGAARAAQIRLVLDSENLGQDAARRLLGVPLDAWHQAAVAWVPADRSSPNGSLQVAARLLQDSVQRGQSLTMLADDRTLWAWIGLPRRPEPDLDRLREGVDAAGGGLRIALGAAATGLAGFRGSHREALRARAVAEAADALPGVVTFDEVAVPALLTQQSDDLQRWIGRVLGDLVADDPGTRQLRETLRVFLECDGSFTHAAARLHLHKNTVHYRIRKAEELRGRPITDGRLDVEVALRAAAALHRRLSWGGA